MREAVRPLGFTITSVPGRPQHSRDLTVTDLLGEPLNRALTLPLPSTSSENLQREWKVHVTEHCLAT